MANIANDLDFLDRTSKSMGQILYELHCESVSSSFEPAFELRSWSQLTDKAKSVWEDTAGKYAEWIRS